MVTRVSDGLDLQGQRVQHVGDPSVGDDAANKNYVDATARGLLYKDAVRVASTANVNIASAPASIDGVTLAASDRVLLKNQTTAAENGIYVYNGSGSAMTRAADMAAAAVVRPAVTVDVLAGTANADQVWHITSPDTDVTVGTTSTTWSQQGGGGGVTSYNGRTGAVTPVKSDITGTGLNAADVGATAKFAINIGDGASTSIAVTHSLGTKDVNPMLRRNSDDSFEPVFDAVATDANTVTFTFGTAPATNAYRAIIVG